MHPLVKSRVLSCDAGNPLETYKVGRDGLGDPGEVEAACPDSRSLIRNRSPWGAPESAEGRRNAPGFPKNPTLATLSPALATLPPAAPGCAVSTAAVDSAGAWRGALRLCEADDASANTSTCVMPAKRISLIVREPSGFVVYITESRSYLTERSVHFPWVVAILFLPLLNVTVASGLCDTQLTSYNPAAIGMPLTEAG